jgi:hypothetical protein
MTLEDFVQSAILVMFIGWIAGFITVHWKIVRKGDQQYEENRSSASSQRSGNADALRVEDMGADEIRDALCGHRDCDWRSITSINSFTRKDNS